MEEVGRPHVVGRVNVDPPVAVEIGEDHAEAGRGRCGGDAGRFGHVGKRPVALVAKEPVRHRWEMMRRTTEDHFLGTVLATWVVGEIDLDIVAHVKIEVAVAVDVAPAAAGGPVRVVQAARPGSHVHEAPPAVAIGLVVVEDDTPPIGHHEIVETVVVVVADGAAHAEARAGQADRFGDVGERPVAVVPIQLVRGEWTVGGHGPDGTVLNAEQVEPAVVVVVDPAQAAAHRLEDVVLRRGRVEVTEPDPTGGGDVHEPGDSRGCDTVS